MKVDVRLFATLTIFMPPGCERDHATLELPDGSTLADLITTLGIPGETALVALVNGQDTGAERPLAEGDVVELFPPLAGGSDPSSGWAPIRRHARATA